MPCYDYRCDDCLEVFEVTHRMGDPAPECPVCGGRTAKVMLSAPAVHGIKSQGRDAAVRSLPECGKGCRCCP